MTLRYNLSRLSDRDAYTALRRDGYQPRTALGILRSYRRAHAWGEATDRLGAKHYGPNGYSATFTWGASQLPPDDPAVRALAALDPNLDRWAIVITMGDDDYHETALDEVKNCDLEVEYFDDDIWGSDERESEPGGALDPDEDPRGYGSHWVYARCSRLDAHTGYRYRYAYLTMDPADARKYHVPKGTARGRVDEVLRANAFRQLESFAEYLDRKYNECGNEAPQFVSVEVRWLGEAVGEASCGGYDRNGYDGLVPAAEAAMAAADMDLVLEAAAEAERWCKTAVTAALRKAEKAKKAAEGEYDDLLLDALHNGGKFPAAAYHTAAEPA